MPTQQKYELLRLNLWSQLERQLASSGQTKGSSQQWRGVIRNLQKKGVSAVEVEWSEIIQLLENHSAPQLHIDELLSFLSAAPPCELNLQRRITDEYAPHVDYEKQPRPTTMPPVRIVNGRREVRVLHYMDRAFGICIWLNMEFDPGLIDRKRYWSLSVSRGRKKLAPHAVRRDFANIHEAMAYGRTLVERMARRLALEGFVGQPKTINHFTRYVLPGGVHYVEWLITAPNLRSEYWGPHFDTPNVVVHARTTERTTPQGERLLLLEEIQSDWNQELRLAIQEARTRHPTIPVGSDFLMWDDDMKPPPSNPYLNHWLEVGLRMMLLLAANQGFAGIAWLHGKLHAERFPWANAEGLRTFYDSIVPAAVEKLGKSWRVQLGTAQFSTLSRKFRVKKVIATGKWQVLNPVSKLVLGEEFPNFATAEAFRRSNETSVLERVAALYLSDEMRTDIRHNGLPYLGAVGKRLSLRL